SVLGDALPPPQAVLHRRREPDGVRELPDPGGLRRHAKRRDQGARARLSVQLRTPSRARHQWTRPARRRVRRGGGRGREEDRRELHAEEDRRNAVPCTGKGRNGLEGGELMPIEARVRKTVRFVLPPFEHKTGRHIVAKVIPFLTWRHSGLGMLQAYLREG